MGRRGRKRQLDLVAEYWWLITSGMGTVAGCREIAITCETGIGGGLRSVASHRSRSARRPARAGSCRCGAAAHRDAASPRPWGAGDRPPARPEPVNGHPRTSAEPGPPRWQRVRRGPGARPTAPAGTTSAVGAAQPGPGAPRRGQQLLETGWSPEQIAAHLHLTYPDRPGAGLTSSTRGVNQCLRHFLISSLRLQ